MIFSLPLLPFLSVLKAPLPQIILVIPFVAACFGLFQTLHTRSPQNHEIVDICVKNTNTTTRNNVRRLKATAPEGGEENYKPPLRIIQITDPHIGPIMSVSRLQQICRNAVNLKPDLIMLTGDFFTAEAYNNNTKNVLADALAPLAGYTGKTFACLGNHDKEGSAQKLVEDGLRDVGVKLLVDESVVVTTPSIGDVQIVGLDWKPPTKGVADHVTSVCQTHPPLPNIPRILLLHDPSAFKHVPPTDNALVLSGHTHGGSVGLLSFGIRASIVSLVGVPDSGLWGHMSNYLYVHRGQGCRSMMGSMLVRLGIPTEDSVLNVYYEDKYQVFTTYI